MQPDVQLPSSLEIIRSSWGPQTSEIRQSRAFDMHELARRLWQYASELLEATKIEAAAAAARTSDPSAGSLPRARQRTYRALRDFLLLRPALCNRETKNPALVIDGLNRLVGEP